jgi:hypothetical protein
MPHLRSGFIQLLAGDQFWVRAMPTRHLCSPLFRGNHDMTRDATPMIVVSAAIDCDSVRYPRMASKHFTGMLFAGYALC